MKKLTSLVTAYAVALTPLLAHATSAVESAPSPAPSVPRAAPASLLEAAEAAAASGVYRVQNTSTVSTGTIREDDKKRSAIAFALSGGLAFVGAGLWRWLPCRGQDAHDFVDQYEGFRQWQDAQCYEPDGQRLGWDTPTKALFAAGIGLELVSLFYLVRHLRDGGEQDDPQSGSR